MMVLGLILAHFGPFWLFLGTSGKSVPSVPVFRSWLWRLWEGSEFGHFGTGLDLWWPGWDPDPRVLRSYIP